MYSLPQFGRDRKFALLLALATVLGPLSLALGIDWCAVHRGLDYTHRRFTPRIVKALPPNAEPLFDFAQPLVREYALQQGALNRDFLQDHPGDVWLDGTGQGVPEDVRDERDRALGVSSRSRRPCNILSFAATVPTLARAMETAATPSGSCIRQNVLSGRANERHEWPRRVVAAQTGWLTGAAPVRCAMVPRWCRLPTPE